MALKSPAPRTFYLPRLEDTFSVFPENGLNPHYATVRPESRAWIDQYRKFVCGPKMRAFMDNCNFELSNAYCYPHADEPGLRAATDLHNILWLYDETTDIESGAGAQRAAIIVHRTLREPDFDDGSWICHMMRDFRINHVDKAGPNVARRFIDNFCSYVEAVGTEAVLREKNQVLDIPGYVKFRREAGAVRTCFDLVEYSLRIDLPQTVHDDPVFISGYNAAMDLIFWTNDLLSYNMEQAKGHSGANVVTVIMKSKEIDIQSAVNFLAGYCEALTAQLLESRRILSLRPDPVFNKNAVRVIDAFGNWVRGVNQWSFATERYFGKDNEAVKKTRIVEIKEHFINSLSLNE
ncbi:terpenoid synthase [Dendrothele bispora CBS 962.96]|uniref:Terpene synthase n=1 Tax=Dendrothele bispora (strain CBS 962.96) TaxID=1314807 RepID=A0A4S8MAZ2_DENBC|nr:terpenoid synthase [Dendrothele bispora CBS 962.96]